MIGFNDGYRNVRPVIGASFVALVALLVCAGATAATPEYPFSGRWRIDTTSIRGNTKPTVIELTAGGFNRDHDGVVKADGRFHQVTSDGYVDETSISVESDHAVKEIDKIRGRLAYVVEYIVSSDGNTLTWHVTSYANPKHQAVKGTTVQRRIGLATKGAHLLSGQWARASVAVDSSSDTILKLDGNRFSWRTDAGTGYDAVVGGKSVKIDGDASGARVLITRPRPDTVVETDLTAQGERVAVLSMQLMPDKKTIRAVALILRKKERNEFNMHRQPSR